MACFKNSCSTPVENHCVRELKYLYVPITMAKIQHTDDNKWWQWYLVIGTLIYCWKKSKRVWLLWKSIDLSYKFYPTLTIWCNNHTPWYLSKGVKNLHPHKNLHTKVYMFFFLQNLEATKMPLNKWMDKHLQYMCMIEFYSLIKWAIKTQKRYEETLYTHH